MYCEVTVGFRRAEPFHNDRGINYYLFLSRHFRISRTPLQPPPFVASRSLSMVSAAPSIRWRFSLSSKASRATSLQFTVFAWPIFFFNSSDTEIVTLANWSTSPTYSSPVNNISVEVLCIAHLL